MSPWHNRDPEQGTYEAKVWAVDEDDAKYQLASLMADDNDSGCESDEEREEWAKAHVDNTGHLMVVLPVIETVKDDLLELLRGPTGDADESVNADLAAILAILGKRCKA